MRTGAPGAEGLLTPAMLHILVALADGPLHGYGILKRVDEFTESSFKLGPGTLYRTLPRLVGLGLIRESEERPSPEDDDERRLYYRLTERGAKAATGEVLRMERVLDHARSTRMLAPGRTPRKGTVATGRCENA